MDRESEDALSAAEGLEFLHEKAEPPVIHGDIKSSNILLFDKDVAKIGDIGVYNEPPIDDPCLDFSGYGAPEFESIMEFDTKTYIDSFGVVLLGLLSGRKALDYTLPRGQQFLGPWASKLIWKDKTQKCVDPRLKGDYPPTALTEMVALARRCVHPKAAHRPSMSIVVRDLRQCSAETSGVEASSRLINQWRSSSLLRNWDIIRLGNYHQNSGISLPGLRNSATAWPSADYLYTTKDSSSVNTVCT